MIPSVVKREATQLGGGEGVYTISEGKYGQGKAWSEEETGGDPEEEGKERKLMCLYGDTIEGYV